MVQDTLQPNGLQQLFFFIIIILSPIIKIINSVPNFALESHTNTSIVIVNFIRNVL